MRGLEGQVKGGRVARRGGAALTLGEAQIAGGDGGGSGAGGGNGGGLGPVEADLVRGRSRSGRTSSSRGRGLEPELLEGRPLSMEPLGENLPPGRHTYSRGVLGGGGGAGGLGGSRGSLAAKQSSAHFKEFGTPVPPEHLHSRPWNSPAGAADVPGGLMRRLPGAKSLKNALEPEVRVDPVLRAGLRPRSQLLALKNGALKMRSQEEPLDEPTLYGPRSRTPKAAKPVQLVLGGSACELLEAPHGGGRRGRPGAGGGARRGPGQEELSFTTHLPTACTTASGKKPSPPKMAPLGLYPLYSSLRSDRR